MDRHRSAIIERVIKCCLKVFVYLILLYACFFVFSWCVVEFPILYVLHPYEILSEETSSPVPRFVCLSDDEWMQRYTETNLAVEALVGSGKPIKSTKTPVLASDRSAKVVDALSTLISAPASGWVGVLRLYPIRASV